MKDGAVGSSKVTERGDGNMEGSIQDRARCEAGKARNANIVKDDEVREKREEREEKRGEKIDEYRRKEEEEKREKKRLLKTVE